MTKDWQTYKQNKGSSFSHGWVHELLQCCLLVSLACEKRLIMFMQYKGGSFSHGWVHELLQCCLLVSLACEKRLIMFMQFNVAKKNHGLAFFTAKMTKYVAIIIAAIVECTKTGTNQVFLLLFWGSFLLLGINRMDNNMHAAANIHQSMLMLVKSVNNKNVQNATSMTIPDPTPYRILLALFDKLFVSFINFYTIVAIF